MAQSLARTGTTAQIIAFPGALTAPVQQCRRSFKLLETVPSLWKFRHAKHLAAMQEQDETARGIAVLEGARELLDEKIAALKQGMTQ